MKTITIVCPECHKPFQYGMDSEQIKLIFELLMQDKDMMRKLGEEAAKAYFSTK